MLIEPTEKSWGPDYVRFGLALASDFAGDNQFNVRLQYRRTWLNSFGAEWVSEAQIGQHTFFSTEWYQPLNEAGDWFVAPTFYSGVRTRGVFVDEDKVADYRTTLIQGRHRRRRAARHVGPAARRVRPVERARARGHRLAAAAVGAARRRPACARRCSSTRPTRRGSRAKDTARRARPIAPRPGSARISATAAWNSAAASRGAGVRTRST